MTRHRVLASVLVVQGAVVLPWGLWRLGQALFGPAWSPGRTGDVVGPPDRVVQSVATVLGAASALVLSALGACALAGGVRLLRRGRSALAAFACTANALAWAVVALWWLMRATEVRRELGDTLPIAALAAVLMAFHVLSVRVAARAGLPPVARAAAER